MRSAAVCCITQRRVGVGGTHGYTTDLLEHHKNSRKHLIIHKNI